MRDSVWAVQINQDRYIFVVNKALLWAETRRAKGIRGGGGQAGAAQRLRRGVYFLDTYLFYVVNFVHLNTMIHYLQRILRLM